ncbi:orotate phosphoribosyltransferase [bacterium MnTg02]|nr:orotate phosphoribosyltransferase [bacterium MnTg02]
MSEPGVRNKAGLRLGGLDQRLRGLARGIADFCLPPICIFCRTSTDHHGVLCAACWRQIDFIAPPLCDRLGIPLPYDSGGITVSAAALANPPAYDRARAVARYDGLVRDLIHRLKYGDRQEGIAMFGRWLAQAGFELISYAVFFFHKTLYRWRLWTRRFNQSAILAEAMSRVCRVEADAFVLRRARPTRSQIGLTIEQRKRNVAGAFQVSKRAKLKITDRKIILVDDVITTGATVEACARTLTRAGAARVDVVVLARVTDTMTIAP